ncbi:MAG: hypothetical protein U1E99_06100 [Agitococcus sp.]
MQYKYYLSTCPALLDHYSRAWGLVSADLGFRGRSLIRSNNRWIMAGGAGLIKIAD